MSVVDRVRMRKKIAQRDPDFAIVRVSCQRFGIIYPPRANGALSQPDLHVLRIHWVSVCGKSLEGGALRRHEVATRSHTPRARGGRPPFADHRRIWSIFRI